MDNLKSPAQPFVNHMVSYYEDADYHYGFTKLEFASLMIAQGMSAHFGAQKKNQVVAEWAVSRAKAVLEEANK